ncbi:sodium/hydrogen exchanger [Methanosalsum zhilinae DSM 4017]|uniref:Sodium/hydrogen exchanger n=1 Tax=Methanosalsum zhilinae (strain DSM 4017 / NBRC 107636 / OCM 62 / WeN5) TaxID=679901 RepID=F7XLB4_METZD|nr:cation:proton antiporter [Methanosalsum zhilinae]AEH60771.1 sodium/hydrogen exchanger [Methanosalsum zhilinae DSM 4017]
MISIDIFTPDRYDILLLYIGLIVLIAALLPRFLSKHIVTEPIFYLMVTAGIFFFYPESPLPHIGEDPYIGKRLTELGVIISLTAAGLKLKRPFAWQTWRYAVRLLVITMPLTIVIVAFFGWKFLGFAPATAMLLGAVIAPTDPVLGGLIAPKDPVLNSDSQITESHREDTSRLALTSEAGLNDGLAFPFTNMAIAMALLGIYPSLWFTDWLITDFFYKIIAGALVGLAGGWLLAKIVLCCPKPRNHSLVLYIGSLSISLTLIPYGIAELISSYGFIAVFVAACVFRYEESVHESRDILLHDFAEETERIMMVILFTMLGIYINHGFVQDFQWYMIPASIFILVIVRPLTGLAGLIGTHLQESKRYIISFYGIRGIGSLYYLLYAFYHASFEQSNEILALTTTIIIISMFIHGLSAKAVMKKRNLE